MYGVMHVVEDPAAAELPAEDADPAFHQGGTTPKTQPMERAPNRRPLPFLRKPTRSCACSCRLGPGVDRGRHARRRALLLGCRHHATALRVDRDFLDPSNHFAGNGDALAGARSHRLAQRHRPHRSEDRAFLGYRLEQGRLVLRWTMNGEVVEERIRPVAGALLEQRAPWAVVWKSST